MSAESWGLFANNGYLNAYDGSGASLTRLKYIVGDVKISGLMRICNTPVDAHIRGGFFGTGYGEPTIPTITLSERLMQLAAAASPGTVGEFLSGTGAYAANYSTFGSGFPYAVHLELVAKGSALGKPDNTLKLWHVQFPSWDLAQGDPWTRSWTGRVLGVPGFWASSVGGAGTVASIDGAIYSRRIDQDGN
jgi:hypothetical protein